MAERIREVGQTIKPIRPCDIASVKLRLIPDSVIRAFNELIAKNYKNGSSSVVQEDVVKRILDLEVGLERDTIFAEGWLDVEEMYRKAGWKVVYDKPGFNETYPATFEFTKKVR